MQKIHFVGIKGVGMAALAVMAQQAGCIVSGSDVAEQFITDVTLQQAGITCLVGFLPEHITDADLVITTGAHGGFDNPEVQEAKKKGIRVVSMAEAVGLVINGELFGKKFQAISVAGTHGKTTTSALIATILTHNHKDPAYFIGTSYIPSLGVPGHFGKGDYFVIEADEYATEPKHDKRAKFLWQHPNIAVFTNIELDHPDIYPDVASVRKTFAEFSKQIVPAGVLIANGDDANVLQVITESPVRVITYGFAPQNTYVLSAIAIHDGRTQFTVSYKNEPIGIFSIHIHGEHNAANALAAIIACSEAGLTLAQIRDGLEQFTGTIRRFEYKGITSQNALLYDDYAHHPTEIKKTLAALRSLHHNKHIVCIFQPHTFSRTQALFEEFVHAFSDADEVILTEIYASARETPPDNFSANDLATALAKVHSSILFLPTLSDVVEYVRDRKFDDKTVIITMGAGNIYRVGELLA